MDDFITALSDETKAKVIEAGINKREELAVLSSEQLNGLGLKLGDIARLRLLDKEKRTREVDDETEMADRKQARQEANRLRLIEEGVLADTDGLQALLPKNWVEGVQAYTVLLDRWRSLPGGSNLHVWEEIQTLIVMIAKTRPKAPNTVTDKSLDFVMWSRLMVIYLKLRHPKTAMQVDPMWKALWVAEKDDCTSAATQFKVLNAAIEKAKQLKEIPRETPSWRNQSGGQNHSTHSFRKFPGTNQAKDKFNNKDNNKDKVPGS